MKISKNLILSALILTQLTGCQSFQSREPASDDSPNSLQGRRINPVRFKQQIYTSINLHDGSKNNWDIGKLNLKSYDISNPQEAEKFYARLLEIKELNKEAKKRSAKNKGFLPKGANLSLEQAIYLLETSRNERADSKDRADAIIHLAEVIASFNYNFQYPVEDQIWVLAFPFKLIKNLDNGIMTKKAKVAGNLDPADSHKPVSQQDPVNSTFWQKPGNISEKNMFYAFNSEGNPRFEEPCTYDGPKDGYGTHGGVELICNGKKWKFKFGNETKTEPFNSRIVWALGYNATPVDYAKVGTRVIFDPKIISEYNSRKELSLKIKSILGFKYKEIDLQPTLNPFVDGIHGAILKDGKFVPSHELESQYAKLEKDIQYLVLREGSVEPENDGEKNLGPWGWTDFDHRDRRELRGFGMLAAWLNLFDMRTDNNRFRLKTEADGSSSLVHYVSDLGSGLGIAKSILHNQNGVFNELPWEFIKHQKGYKPTLPGSKGGPRTPLEPYKLIAYNVLEENETFRRIQLDDARWMARLLAQLTEAQLTDALIVAGMDAAEVKLVLEKLLSRRQTMLKAFGLEKEFPEVMSRSINKKLNYDPRSQGAPVAQGSKERFSAPVTEQILVKGQIKKN